MISSKDPDIGEDHSYRLVDGDTENDNEYFEVEGNALKIKETPVYNQKSSYLIELETKDQSGLVYQKTFTLSVNDLFEEHATNQSSADEM